MSLKWFDLAGRVALVTGAGANGGNGHGIALGLAACGADVFVSDIDDAGWRQTLAEVQALGRRTAGIHCDAGEADQIEAMFTEFDRHFDRIDILVNNVGLSHRARPEELTLENWRRIFRINMESTFLCSMAAGQRMRARGQGGSIINVSSIAGSSALGRGNFVYSASKSAINQFTRELAVEWSIYGIRVNAIQPAQVMTQALRNIFERSQLDAAKTRDRMLVGIPLGRFGEPEDVAKAAVFLASDAAAFITGHLLPVDGGNLALNAGGSRVWPTDN